MVGNPSRQGSWGAGRRRGRHDMIGKGEYERMDLHVRVVNGGGSTGWGVEENVGLLSQPIYVELQFGLTG
jgi:hypothetical protein